MRLYLNNSLYYVLKLKLNRLINPYRKDTTNPINCPCHDNKTLSQKHFFACDNIKTVFFTMKDPTFQGLTYLYEFCNQPNILNEPIYKVLLANRLLKQLFKATLDQ